MANPFDEFDTPAATARNPFDEFDPPAANPFDEFDANPGNEVVVPAPLGADAIAPREQLQPSGRSTITGMTPNEAQARGVAGAQAFGNAATDLRKKVIMTEGEYQTDLTAGKLPPSTGLGNEWTRFAGGVIQGSPGAIADALNSRPVQQVALPAAKRNLPPMAAALLSGGTSMLPQLAFTAGSAVLGETAAQQQEIGEGKRPGYNPREMMAAAATSPLFLAAPLRPGNVPAAIAQGAGEGVAFTATNALATGREIRTDELLLSAFMGAGMRAAGAVKQRGDTLAALHERAKAYGYAGRANFEDIRSWYRASTARNVSPEAPTAPASPLEILQPDAVPPPAPAARPAPPASSATATPQVSGLKPQSPSSPSGGITPEQFRAVARTERLGTLARLSDDQLATLSEQLGLAPRPANPAALPAAQASGLKSQASSAPVANTFAELTAQWKDAGVKLAIDPAKGGVVRLAALEVPEGQRGQGLGTFILKDVRDVSDVTGRIVEVPPPTGPEAERQADWLTRQGFKPYGRANADGMTAWRYVPKSAPKGPRPGFGPRADGNLDLIDYINQLSGVPKPVAGKTQGRGEWDEWNNTFQGPARMLVGSRSGRIDTFIQEIADMPGGPRFDSPSAFYDAIAVVLEERKRVKARAERDQAIGKFFDAALDNKGRAPGEPAGQAMGVDDLMPGDRFTVKGEEVTVVDFDEDGNVTVSGPRIGKQTLPAGQVLYPDKAGITRAQRPADVAATNGWGGEVADDLATNETEAFMPEDAGTPRRSSTANASPAANAEAYPFTDAATPPADDPNFTQLPAELPEAIQFYRQLSGGQYPKIRETIRTLQGRALGVFRHIDGEGGTHSIELRADLFRLVSEAEKQVLAAEAFTWARTMHEAGMKGAPIEELAAKRFNELLRAAEQKALTENPKQALATFWHEVGHFVDWLPDKTLKRGNLLGHIAGFRKHLKGFLAENPGLSPTPEPPTPSERAKLHRQAERELRAQVTETIETIRREEPVYRQIPVTADHITSILKNAQRDDFPQLYDWFTGLDRSDKATVLRAAMKGVVKSPADSFSRREPTGETRIVEEAVRTKIGKEPTPEEIRARFDELLRAEFKRRGLVSQRDLRAEADEVIKWWRGTSEVPDYFKTSIETFADVFSAMLNNPAGVAKRAPTYWRVFQSYLVNRPEVGKAYRAMQDGIKSGAIHRERVENLRDMWHRDEDNSILADSLFGSYDLKHLGDMVDVLANRQTGPIQRRALAVLKTDKNNRVAAAALSGLKNYLYRATGWESFARDLNLHVEAPLAAANLHHDDLSEFLFHSRIAKGDRQQLANPLGWSPKTSAERLAAIEADLGPQRFAALEEAAVTFRAIYEEQVLPLLKQSRMLTPELEKIIEDRTLYATFAKAREFNPLEADTLVGALENAYGKDVTARIYRQIGTLSEVRSPYLATVQKAFSLIATARRQIALKSVVDFLQEHEPQNIIPARERFTDGRWEPVPMETRHVGTLYTLERGKPQAYYVPRPIAETMSHGAPMESFIVGRLHKLLAWPKAILTELNPGFWPVAFAKDVVGAAVQLPKGMGVFRQIPSSWTAARASMLSRPSPLADAALRRLMVISRADNRGEHLGHADELTRILMRMGQQPHLWDAEAKKIGLVLRGWQAWKRQGQVLERTTKIAAMQHLDAAFPNMPEWEKKRIVNEQGGSPDFLEKGRWAPLADFWMMFYNPWLRGLEAAKTSAQRDPRGYWTRFLGTIGLAGAAYWMFEQGWIGDGKEAEETREMMQAIPERDKRRGFAIPLGWSDKDQGKVAYVVLPFPDTLRMIYVGQRGALQAMDGNRPATAGIREAISYQGQDIPGMNPMLKEAGKWWEYLAEGRNPYDDFLGRGVLDDDMVTAGQGGTELALQSVSNLTGGIIYRHRQDRPGETPTEMEKFLQTPVVGNLIGRWVRVSNRGLDEQTDRDVAAVRQREAELRLIADEMITRQMRGEPWSDSQEQLYTEEPYLAQRIVTRQMALMKQATGPEMRAWERAKSVGERMALLEAWSKRAEEKEQRLQN